jgi:hypothetical protein
MDVGAYTCWLRKTKNVIRQNVRRVIVGFHFFSSLVDIMAYPQAVDGGYGLQIWKIAANMPNKQLQTTDEGLASSAGLGQRTDNSSPCRFHERWVMS